MQKRLFILEIGLFVILLVSWFLPYAYDVTPWNYMVEDNFIRSWEFVLCINVPLFLLVFVLSDVLVREDSLIRKILNGLLSVVYVAIIVGYFSIIFEHSFVDQDTIIAILFSLILFLYSFLIQKGTSFARNIVLCSMALPIISHMFDLWNDFQIGAWILNASFFVLVIVAVYRPFIAPKVD